jgi:hypothetical protein
VKFLNKKNILMIPLVLVLVFVGTLLQQKILKVDANVQVLLVSKTAIPFGIIFPGEDVSQTYTVQLDTSSNQADYITTTSPLPNLLNLCPLLEIKNIDSPSEGDTLASSGLKRPGDTTDSWQVKLKIGGINGQLAQDSDGAIIISGGNYGCKITIDTKKNEHEHEDEHESKGKITIKKIAQNGNGSFSFNGSFQSFSIQTDNGNGSKDFSNLASGTYSIIETAKTGWTLKSLSCNDPSSNTTVLGASADIKLGKGETVTCTFTNKKDQSGGEIDGMKFNDKNSNGKEDADESGLAGWTITISQYGNSNFHASTVTDSQGNYSFKNLQPGKYKVREIQQNGWRRITHDPKALEVTDGKTLTHVNFGNKKKDKKDENQGDIHDSWDND